MSSAASTTALRKQIEERLSPLTNELENLLEAEISARVEVETRVACRRLADDLNQAVRRLRQADGLAQISAVLTDACSGFCNLAAVFSVISNEVHGVRVRGLGREGASDQFAALHFSVSDAQAFAGVLETLDPVITAPSAAQLSEPLLELFDRPADERIYLFPLAIEQKAAAVLYASGAVEMAPLELLAQSASSALEARAKLAPPPPPEPDAHELVTIQPASVPSSRRAWDALPPAEQLQHIRAQRFARVRVAEMRLYQADAVKSGRRHGDIYSELRTAIDTARAAYRESFLADNPGMVDYLHLELLGTLAHDDDALLGKDYPGPLV